MKDVSAARMASVARIGSSAPSSAGTRGLSAGLERRRTAIRAATESWPLATEATEPTLAARYRPRRPTVPPVARTDTFQASVRDEQREQLQGGGKAEQPERRGVQGGGEAGALALQRDHEDGGGGERDEDRQCRAHAGPARLTLRGEHGEPFWSTGVRG